MSTPLNTVPHRETIHTAQAVFARSADGQTGTFEILAISAGEGNGWHFPAAVLRASLALWGQVETFLDHQFRAPGGRSLRDLAGYCRDPQWDEARQGIRLRLHPFGPAANVLRELGQAVLGDPPACGDHPSTLRSFDGAQDRQAQGPVGDHPSTELGDHPRVGFSADLLFSAQGNTVERILKVFSVDLVFDPARGGQFLRAFQSDPSNPPEPSKENDPMTEPLPRPETAPAQTAQPESANDLHPYLLETALQAAQLPVPATERLRQQFSGRSFSPQELQDAIDDSRALVAALTAARTVQGPARIHSQFTSEERLQAAVDDLFGVPREAHLQNVRPARLSGIRELYFALTGDEDLHGGIYPERVRLATTSDFSGLVKNAMNKIVVNTWEALGRAGYDWWQRICRVEHFNTLNQVTGILVGTVGSLPSVAEGAAYTELSIGDSPETASFTKYGGYIPLTLELIDRDETHKLRAYPRELASAGLRKISALVAAVFTANGGVGPTLADEAALFNDGEVTDAGGHKNLGTAALDADSWEAACQSVYKQPMLVKNAAGVRGSGPAMAINPRYLLVPRDLQLAAMRLLYPSLERAANIYSENQQRGEPGDVVTVPEWDDATNWAAVCDPRLAPAVYVGERFGLMPEIFLSGEENIGAVFTNDQHRLKVRHFLSVWVNDYRPLYKANVADA